MTSILSRPQCVNVFTDLPNEISSSIVRFYQLGILIFIIALQWRHIERDGVSNHQRHDCLLNRLFRRRSKKTSKLRVTDICAGNITGNR